MEPHDDPPRTRTAATQPEAAAPLSTDEQHRLEKAGEAEHADGPRREQLTQEATPASAKPKRAHAQDGDLISADDRHPRPA